jgi:hypothetical protein
VSRPVRVGLVVLALLLLIALVVWFGGPPGWAPVDDQPGRVHVAILPGSTPATSVRPRIPVRQLVRRPVSRPITPPSVPQPPNPHAKIDATLMDSTGHVPAGMDSLVVVYHDALSVGAYLRRCGTLLPDVIAAILMSNQINSLRRARAPSSALERERLTGVYQAQILDSLWVVQAFGVVMPGERVDSLARESNVAYIEPLHRPAAPPGCRPQPASTPRQNCNTPNASVGVAATWPSTTFMKLHFDAYASAGYGDGCVALLDTGVDSTHPLLSGNGHLTLRLDCSTGNCGGPDPSDMCPHGHGTSSAALLIGNCADGDRYHGLTDGNVDAFRIYGPKSATQVDTRCGPGGDSTMTGNACVGSINVMGAGHAVEMALARCDEVIAFETQLGGSDASLLANCADQAFSAGAVVVAAVGDHSNCQVGSPGMSRSVLAIGAYDCYWGDPSDNSGYGNGSLFKPDVLAPSGIYTAVREAPGLGGFGLSSGATPVAAAEALMLRNWLTTTSLRPSPGQVYAMMVASGSDVWSSTPSATPDGFDHKRGDGKVNLPTDGFTWWGFEDVPAQQDVTEDLLIDGLQVQTLDVGVWWKDPEPLSLGNFTLQLHTQMNVAILQDGQVIPGATSESAVSVFQHTRIQSTNGTLAGTRTIRLHNSNGLSGTTQRIYWCAVARKGPPPSP